MKKSKDTMNEIKMWQGNDFEVKNETSEYVIMQKNTSTFGGHFLVFLFTFWFTFGIGNLIYHLCSYKQHKIMK